MNTADPTPTILLIATFDTKAEEALYLQRKMESLGCRVLSMDTGILLESGTATDIDRHQVAKAAGSSIRGMVASGDKGKCIDAMRKGACALSRKLYDGGSSRASFPFIRRLPRIPKGCSTGRFFRNEKDGLDHQYVAGRRHRRIGSDPGFTGRGHRGCGAGCV
ncbi:MAG: Tm-1-like ATP-binding domain-containing protein [Pseudomonadota bacterium]